MNALQEKKHQKHVAAEFIGTLLFVFLAGASAVNAESSGLVTGALGGGLALAVMIYATAGDNGSGGKLNPAVTAGLLITGRLDKITGAWEMVAQFLGGLCGGILLKISLPHTDLTVPLLAMGGPSTNHPLSTFIWEYMSTAFLVFTVFATVVDKHGRHAESGLKVCMCVCVYNYHTISPTNLARVSGLCWAAALLATGWRRGMEFASLSFVFCKSPL